MRIQKAVRNYCLDCAGSHSMVVDCLGDKGNPPCPLYPFRFGKSEKRSSKEKSGAGIEQIKDRYQSDDEFQKILESIPEIEIPSWEESQKMFADLPEVDFFKDLPKKKS